MRTGNMEWLFDFIDRNQKNISLLPIIQKIFCFKLNPINLDFTPPDLNDFVLSLISAVFGFLILMMQVVLKDGQTPQWMTRKITHIVSDTYIAFIVTFFHSLLGILMAIGSFFLILILLVLFTRFTFLTEYIFINSREEERNYSIMINAMLTVGIMLALFFIFHQQLVIFTAGCLAVAWGDASGEFVGKKIPLIKYKIFNQKSISGSLAVFLFSSLGFLVSALFYQIPFALDWLWKILLGGLGCAVLEAFSWKWIDNIYLSPFGSLIMFWMVNF